MTGLMERRHGRLVGTSGDGVLAEFSSVVEALQCAVEIQRDLGERNAALPDSKRMEFRIGLNVGDVMVEGDDIYGEGVNVAARLEELAEPGGICISGTVYDQVHNKLTLGYDYLGERSVKNISEEVRVYRVDLGRADGARENRSRAGSGRPAQGRASTGGSDSGRGLRRLYAKAATLGVIVVFLLVVDWWRGEGWWVHWVALVAGFVILLDGAKVLFRDDIDWASYRGTVHGDVVFTENTKVRERFWGS